MTDALKYESLSARNAVLLSLSDNIRDKLEAEPRFNITQITFAACATTRGMACLTAKMAEELLEMDLSKFVEDILSYPEQ